MADGVLFDRIHDLFGFVEAAVRHQPPWALRDETPGDDHAEADEGA